MIRIREKNINTKEEFDDVFKNNFHLYNSYQNIKFYNKKLKLNIFNKEESYLDFGCASGASLNKIQKQYNLDCFGVDISDFLINENKKLYPNCKFFTNYDFFSSDLEVDHILSSHTFEHLEDPTAIFNELYKRSKKSLTIIVPNEDSWRECEQHVWRFDQNSFDFLAPTVIKKGLINIGGNQELIFYWNKNKNNKKKKSYFFDIQKIIFSNYKGLLKKILK